MLPLPLPLDNVNKARCSAPTVADGEPLARYNRRPSMRLPWGLPADQGDEMILPVAVRWRLRSRASSPQSLPQHAVIGTVMDIQGEHTVEAYLPVGVCVRVWCAGRLTFDV